MKSIRIALAVPFAILALALALIGCRDVQARTAYGLALAGAELPAPLRLAETEAGKAELERVHAAGGTRQDGERALVEVEKKWAPVFVALDVFMAAEDAWLEAIEAQEDGDWSQLLGAACSVVATAEPLAPNVIGRFARLLKGVCLP